MADLLTGHGMGVITRFPAVEIRDFVVNYKVIHDFVFSFKMTVRVNVPCYLKISPFLPARLKRDIFCATWLKPRTKAPSRPLVSNKHSKRGLCRVIVRPGLNLFCVAEVWVNICVIFWGAILRPLLTHYHRWNANARVRTLNPHLFEASDHTIYRTKKAQNNFPIHIKKRRGR
jgi:hypothetical protein